ncbi:hypothetical protein ACH5RR_038513 [Cinchona calisaya]|uniref:DNA-directed RNA polymerase n=1 Tax=Cinchona calisaya TaxID=153742 RepID=A0ABD2Y0Y6_9GENT
MDWETIEIEHSVKLEQTGRLRSISFNILSEVEAVNKSAKLIGAVSEVTDAALGLPNLINQCTTCGAKDRKKCEGHFGLINFPFTILNPYFLPEVAQILNKICPACKSVRVDKVKSYGSTSIRGHPNNCKYCNGRSRDSYPPMKFKVTSKDVFAETAISAEVSERSSRTRSLHGSMSADYWDIIPSDDQQDPSSLGSNKRVLSHAQVYSILKDVDPRFLESFLKKKSSIFLNGFLLTPNCHRVTELGQHIIFDTKTKLYKKLIDFRGTANELSTRVLDCIKVSKVRSERPSAINSAFSVLGFKDSAFTTPGLKYIKELLLGKRTDHSFRMVVVGDPNIDLGEIGVPRHIAEKLRVSEHVNKWNFSKLERYVTLMVVSGGEICVRRGGRLEKLTITDKLRSEDVLYRPMLDGDTVLINRPPSIHQHSIISLSVRILPINSVLSINPLICSPLRGDFDGDCLHGYVPQSVDSRVELQELVALSKQLLNGQSGRNLLSLSHDSLTAAHLILEEGVTFNKLQMQQLQMFCSFRMQFPAIIKAPGNTCFWTGKQLFSLLIPPGFDYVSSSNGVQINKGEIVTSSNGSSWLWDTDGNLFDSLVKYSKDEVLGFLYAAQEVLCEWLAMRGLSVSLSDLCLTSDPDFRQNMIDEVSCGLQEAELLSSIELLMVDSNQDFLVESNEENERGLDFGAEHISSIQQQKSAVLSQASVSAFKRVFLDIQHLVYHYASKDNSFLSMLKAGSKGNLLKLVQQSMCLGLQHSFVALSFRIPRQLSCAAWNDHKISLRKSHGISEHCGSYIPFGVIENSFLSGLNPLECFVHSLTNRDSSFSGHADVSGTLTRKLMFFMRDLSIGYDGTVRNAYGNQLIQFSYNSRETLTPCNCSNESPGETTHIYDVIGGHPVGSLAACAISEAAYSALDQPISALESSPLLNLKKILDCGVKKISGDKTASLFLTKKLGRQTYGFEYGALEVKDHLQRLIFEDIVSSSMICYSQEKHSRSQISPWVCHFHISKEIVKRRRLRLHSIVDALNMTWKSAKVKLKINLPDLQITGKVCSLAVKQNEKDAKICITVSILERSRNSSLPVDVLRNMVIPFLLGTVIKGFPEFKKVDILWKDCPSSSKSSKSSLGGLYLRVFMSEKCDRAKFWRILVNNCLQIRDMIDWERSHPDDIRDMTSAYGVDAAVNHFLSSLSSAIRDTGKTILPQHLVLTADCLSATGEFVALNAKGLAQQRKETAVYSPFQQACFSSPGDCFVRAAKTGIVDNLEGTVDALSWGMVPSIGTGAQFDIMYAGKGHEPAKSIDIYGDGLLGSIANLNQQVKVKLPNKDYEMSGKSLAQHLFMYDDLATKGCVLPRAVRGHRDIETLLRDFISLKDIQRLSHSLKQLLNKYDIDCQLSEVDKAVVMTALYFHPRRSEKIGIGALEIKVGYHSKYENSRCFVLVRKDGSVEDFSYHKCVHNALQLIAPDRAKTYESKWLKGPKAKSLVWPVGHP